MAVFGGLAIIRIKLQVVSVSMQRNEVCVCGSFLNFRGREHSGLDCALTCYTLAYGSMLALGVGGWTG
jgi:hypothetical protein